MNTITTSEFAVKVVNNSLIIQSGTEKRVYKIDYEHGSSVYKVLKTKVNSYDGGNSLAEWLERETMESMINIFCRKVWQNTKPLKGE